MKDVKQKNKSNSEPIYTLTVELQAKQHATFTYSSIELADAHYQFLQANPVIGQFGVKSVQRSWRQ